MLLAFSLPLKYELNVSPIVYKEISNRILKSTQ